jgi:hypothetical protein
MSPSTDAARRPSVDRPGPIPARRVGQSPLFRCTADRGCKGTGWNNQLIGMDDPVVTADIGGGRPAERQEPQPAVGRSGTVRCRRTTVASRGGYGRPAEHNPVPVGDNSVSRCRPLREPGWAPSASPQVVVVAGVTPRFVGETDSPRLAGGFFCAASTGAYQQHDTTLKGAGRTWGL